MRKVVEQILEGDFDYDNGALDFSCSKIELQVRPGEDVEGSFQIYGDNGKMLEGEVYSSDPRMECLTTSFIGNGEEIAYHFHSDMVTEGEVIKGEFLVISNQGEYYLPYVISMGHTQIESSLGNIKNLFHFANLAKGHPEEALRLFYSADFKRILSGSERQYYQIYEGLSGCPGNRQNMEEFLITINKKQKIEYLTEEAEIRLDDPEGMAEDSIGITKNGWGYVNLEIVIEGDFLYTEKEILTDDDFLGNRCRLPIYIDSTKLHEGKNMGSVLLRSVYDSIVVPVMVYKGLSSRRSRISVEKRRLTVQIMEYYQAFRMKKISAATWLKETGRLVERVASMNEDDVVGKLFQAHMLITQERNNEAGWLLDQVQDVLEEGNGEESVIWAYYLYLTTLVSRNEEYINRVTTQVERIYKKNREEWRIAWLLLYLSEEYGKSATKKMLFLEEQFERGCTSPVIYIEALSLIHANPALLMKLGGFEKQLLLYAAKKEWLSREIVDQAVYLIGKNREFSAVTYRFLEAAYDYEPEDAVLNEICTMLIRGNKVGAEYFPWYDKGVERNLRITRLYEYYMMSVDLNSTEPLPKIVMMYFSYQNSLDHERSAFLYANVYRNRERFPELYANYRNIIEQFVTQQICNQRINKDLAYLYKNILVPRMVTEEVASNLGRLMFVHLIRTERKDIRQVVVYQPLAGKEHIYPMVDGKAYVPLFGSDYTVLLEDKHRNRFGSSVPYTTEKMLLPGKIAKDIAPLVGNVTGYNVYMCMNGKELSEVTPENASRFTYLMWDEAIHEKYRNEVILKLMHYYYEQDLMEELDNHLDNVDYESISARGRGEILKYLILRGKLQQAYELVIRFGHYNVEPKVLLRLCSVLLYRNGMVEDDSMTDVLMFIFRKGKYDERTLGYLGLFYNGMTRELRDIWKASKEIGLNTRELSERIIIQMLFTGSFVGEKMQIFDDYIRNDPDTEVEAAFLCQCAYDYFVRDKVTENDVFEQMFYNYQRDEVLPQVSKLALLKYYAENIVELQEGMKEVLELFAVEMVYGGIYLKFLKEYCDNDLMMGKILDKTIVEYHAHPGARAIIHYVIERDDGEDSEYIAEEMRHVYGGVYFMAFPLFFGESLQYYIVEEMNGQEHLTESGTIQKSDIEIATSEGKFYMINDIVIGNTLQDFNTVDDLLDEYYYKDYMCERLFRLQ